MSNIAFQITKKGEKGISITGLGALAGEETGDFESNARLSEPQLDLVSIKLHVKNYFKAS